MSKKPLPKKQTGLGEFFPEKRHVIKKSLVNEPDPTPNPKRSIRITPIQVDTENAPQVEKLQEIKEDLPPASTQEDDKAFQPLIDKLPERIINKTVWYCRSCGNFFYGPPIHVNVDRLKRDMYVQNRCRICHKATVYKTWKMDIDDNLDWLLDIEVENFRCYRCGCREASIQEINEDSGKLVKIITCESCNEVLHAHVIKSIGIEAECRTISA